MSTNPYPKPNHQTSLSGKPKAFSHVKQIGPDFNRAATGGREKAVLRRQAPSLKQSFQKAHEGPREPLAKPRMQQVCKPRGTFVAAVHSKVERDKAARNRARDLQMKQWREAGKSQSALSRQPRTTHIKRTPDVLLAAARKHRMQQKLQQNRDRGRGGQGR